MTLLPAGSSAKARGGTGARFARRFPLFTARSYLTAMLNGSCACGRVRYEIRGELLGPITYCHCWRCRKHSGSSFGTTAGVKANDFQVVAGKELLSSWNSSPGFHRFFASCCGSPIYKLNDAAPKILGLRMGTLDAAPAKAEHVHFMVGSKVPWLEITDGFPQEPGGVPFGERD